MADFKADIADASQDLKTIEDFVNLPAGSEVKPRLLPSVDVGTLSGVRDAIFEAGGLPAKPFATLAKMNTNGASLADGQLAIVYDETANNGLYEKKVGVWVKAAYDPLTQSKAYTDTSKTSAISTAALDATAKASAAKSEAITAAATDATTKINAAKTDAITASKAYTDDKDKTSAKLRVGKNLFDKAKTIANYGLTTAGVPVELVGNYLSEFITIKPDTAYSFTLVGTVTFYDADKLFLSRLVGANENVISPATAKYLRVVVFNTSLAAAQVEEGAVRTNYVPFVEYIQANSVINSSVKDAEITGTKLRDMTINATKLDDVTWLNMHDATKLVKGYTLTADGGVLVSASDDISEYIPCRPSTVHSSPRFIRVAFYDANKIFISMSPELVFTTPENCQFIRFRLSNLTSNSFQVNEGATSPQTVPQPHKYSLSNMTTPKPTYKELAATRGRLYSFTDAWVAWKNGEKFPIAFLGDSTTQGVGTSTAVSRAYPYVHDVDYISPKSYPSVFQQLIRDATGNTVMRAYNAGFSGTNADYGLDNFDEIFSGVYSDAKMIGISFGINDRKANVNSYKLLYLPKIEALIQKCLDRGIQPFLLSSQPVTIPFWTASGGGVNIEEVGNSYKRELANKYNLEIIDVSKYGELFMQYSTKPLLNSIMENNSNVIHFGDAGHKFTAELVFSSFCKRVIWTKDGERLDYSTQKLDSTVMYDKLQQFATANQGFKLGLNTTQETATDTLLQDFYVFNVGRKQLALTAYYANTIVGQYAMVNGTQTTITSQGQALGVLDLGLHRIKAYSSATTTLDWLGFKLTPTA